MSFGKRSIAETRFSASPRAETPRQPLFLLAGLGALIAVTAIAFIVWRSPKYTAIALSIYDPARLETAAIDIDGPRVFPVWEVYEIYNTAHLGSVLETLAKFADLCGEPFRARSLRSEKTGLNLSVAQESDHSSYRYDIFDWRMATRDKVVSALARERQSFCTRDYWKAIYDYRHVSILTAKHPANAPITQAQGLLKEPTTAVPRNSVDNRPTEPDFNISRMCQSKWPANYSMEEYCVKNQEEARDWAKNSSIDDRIARHCAAKWSADWTMYQYCAKNEMEAKARLGR